MTFAELMREARRLALLQLLADAPGYQANAVVLTAALDAVGHVASHDQVLADMEWCAEMGLVSLEHMRSGDMAAAVGTLTTRGHDAATGRARVPGVKAPLPGERK